MSVCLQFHNDGHNGLLNDVSITLINKLDTIEPKKSERGFSFLIRLQYTY